jgi:hypothetical protein
VSLSEEQLADGDIRLPARGRLRPAFQRLVLRPAVLGFWCVVALAAVSSSQAQPDEAAVINREYPIKAAYLYNFGNYVQWPAAAFPAAETPFVIGVLGDDPFGGLLDEIARTKKLDGRQIAVKRFASMADYSPCHILFVPVSVAAEQRKAAVRTAHAASVLLVGETAGFAQEGGTVGFFLEENKVRFEVNLEVAKREQLKISSKLLSLAKIVGGP